MRANIIRLERVKSKNTTRTHVGGNWYQRMTSFYSSRAGVLDRDGGAAGRRAGKNAAVLLHVDDSSTREGGAASTSAGEGYRAEVRQGNERVALKSCQKSPSDEDEKSGTPPQSPRRSTRRSVTKHD